HTWDTHSWIKDSDGTTVQGTARQPQSSHAEVKNAGRTAFVVALLGKGIRRRSRLVKWGARNRRQLGRTKFRRRRVLWVVAELRAAGHHLGLGAGSTGQHGQQNDPASQAC